MASYGTAQQRPSTISSAPVQGAESVDSTVKMRNDFKRAEFRFVCPLKIPSSPEAASLRIVQNLSHFALYYAHFVWIILLITLIPERKVSLICLVIMTYVASLYFLLLRTFPTSYLLHKVIDKRIVSTIMVIVTMVALIITRAGVHLLLTLTGAIPVVLVHAVFWVREDLSVEGESGGEGELVPLASDHPTSMV